MFSRHKVGVFHHFQDIKKNLYKQLFFGMCFSPQNGHLKGDGGGNYLF